MAVECKPKDRCCGAHMSRDAGMQALLYSVVLSLRLCFDCNVQSHVSYVFSRTCLYPQQILKLSELA